MNITKRIILGLSLAVAQEQVLTDEMFHLNEDSMIVTEHEAAEIKTRLEVSETEPKDFFSDFEESLDEQTTIGKRTTSVDLQAEPMHNQVIGKERASDRIQKISKVQGSSARKPVYGVLTEPLEGDLQGKSDKVEAAERSYVPRAHVQFLE
jgi:hypothetical protein